MAQQQFKPKSNDCEVYLVDFDIISGHSLAAKDIDGKSDPFVKISILDNKVKTKTIKNNLNPVWNESFSFRFLQNPKMIELEVLDQDLTGEDHIGSAVFLLQDLFNSKTMKPFEGHLKLKEGKRKKVKGATIKIRVQAQRFEPVTLQTISDEQKKTIFKQNREIMALNEEIENLDKKNARLRRENDKLVKLQRAQEDAALNQPGSKPYARAPDEVPTIARDANKAAEGLRWIKIWAIWQLMLRKLLYGMPLIGYFVDLLVLFVGSLLRLEVGYHVFAGATSSKRPKKMLTLYELEGDAQCKMVREVLCALDLDCLIYPCPQPLSPDCVSRFRDEANKKSKEANAFPVLVDENEADGELVIVGGANIVERLMSKYGNNVKLTLGERVRYRIAQHKVALMLYDLVYLKLLRSLGEFGNEQMDHTMRPKQGLELFSYEASPFCIKVREVLCSMEIPYVLRNIAHGSEKKREEFQKKFGEKYPKWRQKLKYIQVPLLMDHNTEKNMVESEDIKSYLMKEYINVRK